MKKIMSKREVGIRLRAKGEEEKLKMKVRVRKSKLLLWKKHNVSRRHTADQLKAYVPITRFAEPNTMVGEIDLRFSTQCRRSNILRENICVP